MDTGIISIAGTIQLIALALGIVMVLVLGARIFSMGPRGFASLIGELGALLVAVYIIIRPNDVMGLLIKSAGGIQTPVMPK